MIRQNAGQRRGQTLPSLFIHSHNGKVRISKTGFVSVTFTVPGSDENAAVTGNLNVTNDLTIAGANATTTAIAGNGIDRARTFGVVLIARALIMTNAIVCTQAIDLLHYLPV